MTSNFTQKVDSSIFRLFDWLNDNGWAGYDPYDIRERFFYKWVSQTKYPRLVVEKLLINRWPLAARRFFLVKPRTIAKGMGLFAHAFCDLAKIYDEKKYLTEAQECLDWLQENKSRGYSGNCWGYPFHWYAKVTIPRLTPSGVVTSVISDAFFAASESFSMPQYRQTARDCLPFFLNDLNIDIVSTGQVCFSYTPLDHEHIHNANLFVAKQLMRFGLLDANEELTSLASRAINYTLSHQCQDGSWNYSGPAEPPTLHIDHYHTGFVLRTLFDINEMQPAKAYETALRDGLAFYCNNFFEADGLPKLYPPKWDPVDIHSCAEAILCLSTMRSRTGQYDDLLARTTAWTLDNMQSSQGYFFYRKTRTSTLKIPFIRWGQAWMLRALSALRKSLHNLPLNNVR